jgi:hypothetical protein
MAILTIQEYGNNLKLYKIYETLYNMSGGGGTLLSQAEFFAVMNGTNPQGFARALFESTTGTNRSLAEILQSVDEATINSDTTLSVIAGRLADTGVSAATYLKSVLNQLVRTSDNEGITDMLDVLLQTTQPNRIFAPQDITGNTEVRTSALTLAANSSVYTVTGGKTGYVSYIQMSMSATAQFKVLIRDGNGGTIIATFVAGAVASTITVNYPKPVKITNGLYFNLVSGAGSFDIVANLIEK